MGVVGLNIVFGLRVFRASYREDLLGVEGVMVTRVGVGLSFDEYVDFCFCRV